MTLSLAFLSPVLAEAAMEGRLPRGFSVKRLTELPMLWSEQWGVLGLQEPTQARAPSTHASYFSPLNFPHAKPGMPPPSSQSRKRNFAG